MKPSSEKLVLVVEDDEPKQRSLVEFLVGTLTADARVEATGSLSSAIRVLSTRPVTLAVVDMSLPTFDFATDRTGGGQPQGFGGADILRFIKSETEDTFSVVLNEEFPSARDGVRRDLQGLEAEFTRKLGERFLGVIHYAGQHGEWKAVLKDILVKVDLVGAQ